MDGAGKQLSLLSSFSFSPWLWLTLPSRADMYAASVQEGGWQGRRSGAAQLRGGEDQGPAGFSAPPILYPSCMYVACVLLLLALAQL